MGAGGAGAHYENHFTCLRRKIAWRVLPGFNSTEPKIYGVQSAIVVGPAGEEIHTDVYGRVKVQFHWDRVGQYDHRSSAWVRVASIWAGDNFGGIAIPRVGQEVLVQWLDGNPDRPLVTGSVYNAHQMPPWQLPAGKRQTGILSRSTPAGADDNANALRFDDTDGHEEVWLHAEQDQRIEVERDESHWVGRDRRKTIDRDETVHVKHDRTETVDHDETITVHNNRTERVDHDESISIGDNRTEDVGKDETIAIGNNRSETVGVDETIGIGRNRSETVGANESVTIGGSRSKAVAKNESDRIGKGWSIKVGKTKTETIGMAYTQNVGMGRMENVGLGYSLNVGAAMATVVGMVKSTNVGASYSITAGASFTVTVGAASLTMSADGTIELHGTKILINGSEHVDVDSQRIDLN